MDMGYLSLNLQIVRSSEIRVAVMGYNENPCVFVFIRALSESAQ